uniref:Uncharacterized protein n=1 Tax=Ciona savignyi TaxID=51511 RepID=H2YD67_CIOSA
SSNFTPNSASTSNFTQAQKISNYEKALISAASSLYQQQKKPTPGGGGGTGG